MICIFFAPGFEEIEGIAVVDILRRAGLEATMVGVGSKTITGSHDITVTCDIEAGELNLADLEAVILPGGIPGTPNLEKSPAVKAAINHAVENDLLLCAICAAPSILGRMGLLAGKRFTCYPGVEKGFEGIYSSDRVVRDGNLITGKGAGAAVAFGIEIVSALCGEDKAKALEASLQ